MYLTFYTDKPIPTSFAGYTFGPIILIRPKYRDDKGLLEHEKVHVKQFWRTLGTHWILYKLSKNYRLKCEVEAYKVQLKYSPDNIDHFVNMICEKYDLDLFPSAVKRLLTE